MLSANAIADNPINRPRERREVLPDDCKVCLSIFVS
jgi:hypothetical protein